MQNPSGGRVLLSGASGMIGGAIRGELSSRQMQMLQLSRSSMDPNRGKVGPYGTANGADGARALQYVAVSISGEIPWNPAKTPAMVRPELLEGLTAAIHLSGANVAAHRWTPAYKREIATSRVNTTRVLAKTLAGLERPPQVLLVASATGIYGERGDEVLDESSRPGSGFLADLCQDWEAAAQPAADAGIRVVNLRFGVVLSERSGALHRMLPLFRWGLGGRLGSGRQWTSWISVADVVAAIFFLMERTDLSGAFNLVAPAPVTNAELTRALAKAVRRPAIFPAPAAGLRLAFGEMADETLLASERVVPARLTAAGFEFTHPTIEEALAAALAKR